MKKVKMFICMAMAVALLCHTTTTVWAAVTHKEGCNNTTYEYAECGTLLATPVVGGHTIYEGDQEKTCSIVGEVRRHRILCANSDCRVSMGDDEARVCKREHGYCGKIDSNVCNLEY